MGKGQDQQFVSRLLPASSLQIKKDVNQNNKPSKLLFHNGTHSLLYGTLATSAILQQGAAELPLSAEGLTIPTHRRPSG